MALGPEGCWNDWFEGSPQFRRVKIERQAEESVGFWQEQRTQRTRTECKRKGNTDMFIWTKEKEDACCERG